MATKERAYNIDIVKGIGILLVIIGHSGCPTLLCQIIYTFHMPLFFFLSGYLFDRGKMDLSIKDYTLRRAKSLLWPYLIFAIITSLFYSLLELLKHSFNGTFMFKQISALVYSNYIFERNYTGVIWFLTALFVTELMYFIIRKTFRNNRLAQTICILAFIVIGLLWPNFTEIRLPWGCEIAFTAILFYAVGYLVKTRIAVYHKSFVPTGAIFLAGGGILGCVNCQLCGIDKVDMLYLEYGNPLLFSLAALFMSVGLLLLFQTQYFKNKACLKRLQYVGRNSLCIMAVHVMIMDFLKTCFSVLNISFSGIWVILTLLCLTASLIVTFVINKYFSRILFLRK